MLLPNRAASFVDPSDRNDPFPSEVWAAVGAEVGRMEAAGLRGGWSGGRFGCATVLRHLPALAGYSLGEVQHLVQLALRRKLVGYAGGKVMPYSLSVGPKREAKTAGAENGSVAPSDVPTQRMPGDSISVESNR